MGLADHLHDLGENRFLPDPLGPHQERTRLIDRSTYYLVALNFLHRDCLPGNHRFIDTAPALGDFSVHGNLVAGDHAEHVALSHLLEGHLSFLPTLDDTRGRRCQGKQFPKSAARAAVRPALQDLAEQNQCDNH